jgi:hypothetical protein
VKARFAWLAGGIGVGVAAAYRALRPKPAALPPAHDEPDPRAEELRQKLAEARTALDEREEFEAAETPVDEAVEPVPNAETEPESPDLDERRRRVHERARSSAKKMRGREPEG